MICSLIEGRSMDHSRGVGGNHPSRTEQCLYEPITDSMHEENI